MVPQHTTIFSKELIKQLEEEQSVVIKELLAFEGWFTIVQSTIIGVGIKISHILRKK